MAGRADDILTIAKHEEQREENDKEIQKKRENVFEQPAHFCRQEFGDFSAPRLAGSVKSVSCIEAGS